MFLPEFNVKSIAYYQSIFAALVVVVVYAAFWRSLRPAGVECLQRDDICGEVKLGEESRIEAFVVDIPLQFASDK